MLEYIVRRLLISIPILFIIAIIGFITMELPQGDYVTRYIAQLEASGQSGARERGAELRKVYQLDDPAVKRFITWISRFVTGDFGESFYYQRPVRTLIAQRLPLTLALTIPAFLISWAIGISLGIYSATHQYSLGDNVLTVVAFLGLGLPAFLVALIMVVAVWQLTGDVYTGLFSADYAHAPWSIAKIADLLKHLAVPVFAVVFSGMAWVMRVMRGNLLDELRVNYVQATRAKGVPERTVIFKHAVRNAFHPLVMALGGVLAWLLSGTAIVEQVIGLPTLGPLFIQATMEQDVYLSGTILILLSTLLVIGNLLADVGLAFLDPRIRYD
jgi:peptide/nickel transport system permease protein